MIENRVHRVRDVTMGEDAGQARAGRAPQALAALRNGLLGLLRAPGWTQIADALRHYGAFAHRALALLTTPLHRTLTPPCLNLSSGVGGNGPSCTPEELPSWADEPDQLHREPRLSSDGLLARRERLGDADHARRRPVERRIEQIPMRRATCNVTVSRWASTRSRTARACPIAPPVAVILDSSTTGRR